MPTTTSNRRLGQIQKDWLVLMNEDHKGRSWFDGCGFLWDTPSHTEAICVSLARRGLMTSAGKVPGPYGDRPSWKLTRAGVVMAQKILEERRALNRQGTGQGE